MTPELKDRKFESEVQKDVERIRKADRERPTLMAQTVYLGTLGLVLVLPIVGGAYLGSWMDEKLSGFSFSWTVTLIVLGVFVGALDVYLFVREKE